MIRRPPRSTLFPTRRSSDLGDASVDLVVAVFLFNYLSVEQTRQTMANVHRDRKSTRLNSSHVAISYAVFCLKKKNLPDYNFSSHARGPCTTNESLTLIHAAS